MGLYTMSHGAATGAMLAFGAISLPEPIGIWFLTLGAFCVVAAIRHFWIQSVTIKEA